MLVDGREACFLFDADCLVGGADCRHSWLRMTQIKGELCRNENKGRRTQLDYRDIEVRVVNVHFY